MSTGMPVSAESVVSPPSFANQSGWFELFFFWVAFSRTPFSWTSSVVTAPVAKSRTTTRTWSGVPEALVFGSSRTGLMSARR